MISRNVAVKSAWWTKSRLPAVVSNHWPSPAERWRRPFCWVSTHGPPVEANSRHSCARLLFQVRSLVEFGDCNGLQVIQCSGRDPRTRNKYNVIISVRHAHGASFCARIRRSCAADKPKVAPSYTTI